MRQIVLNKNLIKKELKAREWTQLRLAQELGTDAQTVSRWLTGKNEVNMYYLFTLAKTLNVKIDDLVMEVKDGRG